MGNLFIIGNGFDLAHYLPTSYQDFYEYLKNIYPDALDIEPTFSIEGQDMPDGSLHFNKDEVVAFIIDIISKAEKNGDDWQDIETSLGRLNYDSYFDEMSYIFGHEDDDSSYFRMANRNETVASNFHLVTLKFKELFAEWIETIDTSEVKSIQSFDDLVEPYDDTFLTFNYTDVLETVYGAIDVKHIHVHVAHRNGWVKEELIIGHGEKSRDFQNRYTGSEGSLLRIHDSLRKNTQKIIEREHEFFNNLTSIEKIYSYGFSFSNVDLPYIKEICSRLNTMNITWFLHDYGKKEDREKFKKIIRECGFKGEIKEFSA